MRHLLRLGYSLAAGAVAGAALAPLQLLLWAEARVPPARALLAVLAWTSWGALWFGIVFFLLLTFSSVAFSRFPLRRREFTSLWRRLMVLTFFLVASVAVWNREAARDLLVPANRQALAVAAWLAGGYALATLLLGLRRRVSHLETWLSLAATACVVAALWGVWRLTPPTSPPPSAVAGPDLKATRNLLFVSWEGADLPWLLPLLEHQDMPFLQSQREKGAWGQIRTIHPYTRSAALATLVTGCAPAVHGVLGKRSYRLSWLLEQPVTLLLAGPWPTPHQLPWRAWQRVPGPSPQRAPLWSILDRAGLPAGNAGWPRWSTGGWDLQPPLASEATPFEKLDADLRAAVEPALAALPEAAPDARRAFAVATDLHTAVVQRAQREGVRALVVNTRLVAQLRPAWTPLARGEPSEDTLREAARLLDTQLQQLWTLLGGENTLLVVASPYGMAPPSPWRRLGNLVGRANQWRVSPDEAPDGFVLFSGPGTRAGERFRPRRLTDVLPTVLYLLELPVARDMAGSVILEAVNDDHAARVPLRRVTSYPAVSSRKPLAAERR